MKSYVMVIPPRPMSERCKDKDIINARVMQGLVKSYVMTAVPPRPMSAHCKVGRASDSRSKGTRYDPRQRQENKKNV